MMMYDDDDDDNFNVLLTMTFNAILQLLCVMLFLSTCIVLFSHFGYYFNKRLREIEIRSRIPL